MPLIEELPVTAPTRVSHGWAYVPDIGPIPAMAPSGARKRNRHDAGTTNATATAKLQKSILQRLESLDRENYKDGVVIPIPARVRGGGESKAAAGGKKVSNNVRRILTYQRTFQHYLADEEAGGSGGSTVTGGGSSAAQSGAQTSSKSDGRRKSGVAPATTTTTPADESTPKRSRRGQRRESEITVPAPSPVDTTPRRRGPGRPPRPSTIKHEEDTDMTETTSPVASTSTTTPTITNPTQPTSTPHPLPPRALYDPSLDTHPLLRTLDLPLHPSRRLLTQLLSEPPLSYTAARAPNIDAVSGPQSKPTSAPTPTKPPRHFCALCGYWGKIKCRKCGEWTCGLMDCWKGHESGCIALGMY